MAGCVVGAFCCSRCSQGGGKACERLRLLLLDLGPLMKWGVKFPGRRCEVLPGRAGVLRSLWPADCVSCHVRDDEPVVDYNAGHSTASSNHHHLVTAPGDGGRDFLGHTHNWPAPVLPPRDVDVDVDPSSSPCRASGGSQLACADFPPVVAHSMRTHAHANAVSRRVQMLQAHATCMQQRWLAAWSSGAVVQCHRPARGPDGVSQRWNLRAPPVCNSMVKAFLYKEGTACNAATAGYPLDLQTPHHDGSAAAPPAACSMQRWRACPMARARTASGRAAAPPKQAQTGDGGMHAARPVLGGQSSGGSCASSSHRLSSTSSRQAERACCREPGVVPAHPAPPPPPQPPAFPVKPSRRRADALAARARSAGVRGAAASSQDAGGSSWRRRST